MVYAGGLGKGWRGVGCGMPLRLCKCTCKRKALKVVDTTGRRCAGQVDVQRPGRPSAPSTCSAACGSDGCMCVKAC